MSHVQMALGLAKENSFAYILAASTFYLGYIIVATEVQQGRSSPGEIEEGFELMRQGMAQEAAIGSKGGLSSRWLLLADAHRRCGQIDQAWQALQQGAAEANGRQELYFEAEILRVKGALHLLTRDADLAEGCFQQAIRSARRQKARLWELKAATALCRHWQQQGNQDQARQLLADVMRWFDNEFTSPDVLDAQALAA